MLPIIGNEPIPGTAKRAGWCRPVGSRGAMLFVVIGSGRGRPGEAAEQPTEANGGGRRAIRAGHPVGADEPSGGCVIEKFLLADRRGLVSEIGGHLVFPFGLSGDLLMSTSSARTSRLPSADRSVAGALHPSFLVAFESPDPLGSARVL